MSEVTRSHTLSLGLVGLPNSGKSTLFNALTKQSVPVENYPFCTIDKNIGVVQIPDERLEKLANLLHSERVVPSVMTFVDIAGLLKGASKGEGLGNQFLGHIREVDVVIYVLRAFSSEEIVHVYNRVDPIDDFEILEAELILKDLESMEKKHHNLFKSTRVNSDSNLLKELELAEKIILWLKQGKPVIEMEMDRKSREIVNGYQLLTNKRRMLLLNCKEEQEEERVIRWIEQLKEIIGNEGCVLQADLKLLSEIEGKQEYQRVQEKQISSVESIIIGAYRLLELITFYTGNQQECNAWSIQRGADIKSAASVIHSDLGKYFISADVVNVEKLISNDGWVSVKEKGLVRNHGKEYIVEDGDYIIVLANTR